MKDENVIRQLLETHFFIQGDGVLVVCLHVQADSFYLVRIGFLDEDKELLSQTLPAVLRADEKFLNPQHLAARLLRVGMGEQSVTRGFTGVIHQHKALHVRSG